VGGRTRLAEEKREVERERAGRGILEEDEESLRGKILEDEVASGWVTSGGIAGSIDGHSKVKKKYNKYNKILKI
jgi:hypothetical protein